MLLDTIGDAPPDYAFDYDGVEPWAWETADRYDIYAEPIDDGWRYYYYAPGAIEPFLVRDPAYSYGYRNGRVVAVYGGDGRYLDRVAALRQAEAAARYFARAGALRAAARDQSAARHRLHPLGEPAPGGHRRAAADGTRRARIRRRGSASVRSARRTSPGATGSARPAWRRRNASPPGSRHNSAVRPPASTQDGRASRRRRAWHGARRPRGRRTSTARRSRRPRPAGARRQWRRRRPGSARSGAQQAQIRQRVAADARQRIRPAQAEAAAPASTSAPRSRRSAQHRPAQGAAAQARSQALRVRTQNQPQAVHPAAGSRRSSKWRLTGRGRGRGPGAAVPVHRPRPARQPWRLRQAPFGCGPAHQAQVRTPPAAAAAPAHRRPDPEGHGQSIERRAAARAGRLRRPKALPKLESLFSSPRGGIEKGVDEGLPRHATGAPSLGGMAREMTAGYSGTPLAKKLSLKDGMRTWWDEMPPHVRHEIENSASR